MNTNPATMPHAKLPFNIRYTYLALLLLTYALVASSTEQAFLQKWRTLNSEAYTFEQFMDYGVPRPYAYRVLMPSLVNLLYSLEPIKSMASLPAMVSRGALIYGRDDQIENWEPELHAKYILTGFLMFGFLLIAMYSLRGITEYFLGSRIAADVSPVLFMLALPLTFRGDGGFIYDFSEIGLYFLALHALLKGKRSIFLMLVPLMVANKESSILIVFFSAVILYSTEDRAKAHRLLLAQGVVAAASYFSIKFAFSGAPGGTVEFHFPGNLEFWLDVKNYLSVMTTSTLFLPFPKPSNVLLLLIIAFSIGYEWSRKPKLLRHLFLVSLLINAPLFFLFCFRDEFRNLSLTYPYLHLLLMHTLITYHRLLLGREERNTKP